MISTPIPRCMLPDTMIVSPVIDGEHGTEFGNDFEIQYVRFDSAASVDPKTYSDGGKPHGIVYVDAVNSVNAKKVKPKSRVTIGGETLSVIEVNEYKTFNGKVHHWELKVQ